MLQINRNGKFYSKIKKYTELAYQKLIEFSHKTDVPNEPIMKWKQNGNIIERVQEYRKKWHLLVYELESSLHETAEYDDLLKYIKQDSTISRYTDKLVGVPFVRMRVQSEQIINYPLFCLLHNNNGLVYDEDDFDRVYQHLEEYLYSSDVVKERITPIQGLDIEDEIKFDEHIALKKLSPELAIELLDCGLVLAHEFQDTIIQIPTTVLYISFPVKKLFGELKDFDSESEYDQYYGNFLEEELISILRLYKPGTVFLSGTLTKVDNLFSKSTSPHNRLYHHVSEDRKYKLLASESLAVVDLWKNQIHYKKYKYILIALRRFSRACRKDNFEDSILDHFIGFEALFLSDHGKDRGELRYRLSQRISFFIEDTPIRRFELFTFMKSAYDLRSGIVHGREYEMDLPKKANKKYTKDEFLVEIENLHRIALNKVMGNINANSSHQLQLDWDKVIFGE